MDHNIFAGDQPNSETFQTLVHQVVPKRGMAFSRTCSCDNNIVPQGSDIAWGTFLHPFLSESWLVVMVVLLLTAATLALVVMAGRYLPCFSPSNIYKFKTIVGSPPALSSPCPSAWSSSPPPTGALRSGGGAQLLVICRQGVSHTFVRVGVSQCILGSKRLVFKFLESCSSWCSLWGHYCTGIGR